MLQLLRGDPPGMHAAAWLRARHPFVALVTWSIAGSGRELILSSESVQTENAPAVDWAPLYRDRPRMDRTLQGLFSAPDQQPEDVPALHFFAWVWLRCFFLYGQCAQGLMAQADAGDSDAVRRLVSLDRGTIADPQIARRVSAVCERGNEAERTALRDAMFEPLDVPSRLSLKARMAGLIRELIRKAREAMPSIGREPSAAELADLFRAIAEDDGRRELDIPDDYEQWRKRVDRAQKEVRALVARIVEEGKRTKSATEVSGSASGVAREPGGDQQERKAARGGRDAPSGRLSPAGRRERRG